ncbi:MAG: carboxypeptidase-like regulatory domain-containing protein [Bacteroidales bacterium]|nr:carboxypeptidase-like regulatory domain-containing protein [Bacteroidales bacterium]
MNHRLYLLIITVIFLFTGFRSGAQETGVVTGQVQPTPELDRQVRENDRKLVQFTGITITADSLSAVPYAKIIVKTSREGTTSDAMGYFSFVAHIGDTILFNAMGYKPASFIIPDTIRHQRYSLIQLMTADTLTLQAAIIFPWPTYEDFKQAFTNIRIPDDDLERARKNLAAAKIQMMADQLPMDARMNYNNYIENQTSKLYYFGQQQPFSIFNPFAWAQFIKAWKEGKFKRKTYDDD